jgi:Proteasome subunit
VVVFVPLVSPSLLVAGSDGDGTPRLYQVDPLGDYFGWKATAIGKVNITQAKQQTSCIMDCVVAHMFCSHSFLYIVRIMSMPRAFWKKAIKMTWSWKMPFILLS